MRGVEVRVTGGESPSLQVVGCRWEKLPMVWEYRRHFSKAGTEDYFEWTLAVRQAVTTRELAGCVTGQSGLRWHRALGRGSGDRPVLWWTGGGREQAACMEIAQKRGDG